MHDLKRYDLLLLTPLSIYPRFSTLKQMQLLFFTITAVINKN